MKNKIIEQQKNTFVNPYSFGLNSDLSNIFNESIISSLRSLISYKDIESIESLLRTNIIDAVEKMVKISKQNPELKEKFFKNVYELIQQKFDSSNLEVFHKSNTGIHNSVFFYMMIYNLSLDCNFDIKFLIEKMSEESSVFENEFKNNDIFNNNYYLKFKESFERNKKQILYIESKKPKMKNEMATNDDLLKNYLINSENVKVLQSRFAKILVGDKLKIIDKQSKNIKLLNIEAFKEGFKHMNEFVSDDGKKPVKKYAVYDFMENEKTEFFQEIVFDPKNEDKTKYNLYKGLGIGFNRYNVNESDVEMFLRLVRSLTNHDEKGFEYVLNYISHMIQKPEEKPGTAIYFRGEQGTGKGTLITDVLGRIIGRHFKHLTDDKIFTSEFNAEIADSLLTFFDEALFTGNKKVQNQMKTYITEKEIVINDKGISKFIVNNYARVFGASNESWVAPVEKEDRRYVIFDTSNELRDTGKEGFFKEFNEWLNNKGIEKIFNFLINRDITKFNPRILPMTDAKKELMIDTFNSIESFLSNLLTNDINFYELEDSDSFYYSDKDNVISISVETLFKGFYTFSKQHFHEYKIMTKQKFALEMKKILNREEYSVVKKIQGKTIRIVEINNDDKNNIKKYLRLL